LCSKRCICNIVLWKSRSYRYVHEKLLLSTAVRSLGYCPHA
jgi:hypothetical protein